MKMKYGWIGLVGLCFLFGCSKEDREPDSLAEAVKAEANYEYVTDSVSSDSILGIEEENLSDSALDASIKAILGDLLEPTPIPEDTFAYYRRKDSIVLERFDYLPEIRSTREIREGHNAIGDTIIAYISDSLSKKYPGVSLLLTISIDTSGFVSKVIEKSGKLSVEDLTLLQSTIQRYRFSAVRHYRDEAFTMIYHF